MRPPVDRYDAEGVMKQLGSEGDHALTAARARDGRTPRPAPTARSDRAERRIAVVQSSYIPWKGYFDLIAAVDEFVLYDDAQYTRRDWRNRNQIKTARGLQWLTIPVNVKGNYRAAIKDITVAQPSWASRHWKAITHSYARAPAFGEVAGRLEALYAEAARLSRLSEVNFAFIQGVCRLLGITTRLSWSMEYDTVPGQTARLVSLCQQTGTREYLSGPTARTYLDEGMFEAAGIRVIYADYSGYPEYRQLH